MERSPEFRQLLIGISTIRYLPPSGTAGFDRSFVNGNRRVPAPPPMTMARVRCVVPGGRAGMGIAAAGFAKKESRVERFFVSTKSINANSVASHQSFCARYRHPEQSRRTPWNKKTRGPSNPLRFAQDDGTVGCTGRPLMPRSLLHVWHCRIRRAF